MTSTSTTPTMRLDAVVLGAGVAGLYQLHQLRERGLDVKAFDAAGDVGGTWWWNRYPGARFDSEMHTYQYLFDESLYKDWTWSERFPGQPEIERWLHYVTDRLDLRRDITFSTRVTEAHFDDDRGRWTIRTDRGDVIDTQFFVSCAGMLSAPVKNIPGTDDFAGELVFTSSYPEPGPDVAGKRVGVVGVGATGIQVIQTLAGQAGHLTVFARTPQYVLPMKNPPLSEADQEDYKKRFEETKETLPHTFSGFQFDFEHEWAACTPEQRLEIMEEAYAHGSLKFWLASFGEMFFSSEIGEEVSEFVREKMRARLADQRLIDILVPTDYTFGTHRVPLENGYLEAYLRDDVDLVSVLDNPIVRIRPEGIELADGSVHELDVIILATGFDAGSGALSRIDIRGRDGRSLAEEWGRDIKTTMGLAKEGFPNLLTTAAPLAPSAALCNMTTCLQQQTEWITGAIADLQRDGKSVIEPTAAGEDAWVAHHEELAHATVVMSTHSWYLGSNVPGKPRRLLSYIGGVGEYRQRCDEESAAGYPSFTRT